MTNDNMKSSQSKSQDQIGQDTILKVSKEIAIKFIEMGRVTPATFDKTFKSIHQTIKNAVAGEE